MSQRGPHLPRGFTWTGVEVRWYPRLKVWRVLKLAPPQKHHGKDHLVRELVAASPVEYDAAFTRELVGEQARQLAETTWRLENGE